MNDYDYSIKVYSTGSIWNLRPDEEDDTPPEVISATNERLELSIPVGGSTFIMVATGDFQWSGIAAVDNPIYGTVTGFKAYLDGTLFQEEQFPDGTSANAWQNGGAAFQVPLLTGNDFFAGSPLSHDAGQDGVRGGDGNDTFIGYGSLGGQDYFFGEGGIDTSIYRGTLSEYTIEPSSEIWDGRLNDGTRVSGYIVTDSVEGRDDMDQLVEVERLQFSDVTLALDIDGIAAEAYRIYKAAFDRQPDATGLGFWIKNMDAGMGLEAVAQEFINSAEFIRMYGPNPTDEQFVDLLYANVLDRQADQSGYDFWIGALDRGLTRAGLLAEFSESPENVSDVAPMIENGIQYTAFVA